MNWTRLVQARVLAIISERAAGRWVCVGGLALGVGDQLGKLGYEVTIKGHISQLPERSADNVLLADGRQLSAERRDALRGSYRVLRPGGTLVTVAPGRLTSVCAERLGLPGPPASDALTPDEFDLELTQAGFAHVEVMGSDGFFSFAVDPEERMRDLYSRASLLAVLRRLGEELGIVGTSSWLLGVAIRGPGDGAAVASSWRGSGPPLSAPPAANLRSEVLEVDRIMAAYYEAGVERGRLESGSVLEFERTKVVLGQRLPRSCRVLDVGGGPGTYAAWLARHGHQVTLIDPIALHVEQAQQLSLRGPSFDVRLGDARQLAAEDESADAVVMMGPLFHLVHRDDRLAALREAFRVLRRGGVLLASAMGRMFLLGHAVAADTIRARGERDRVLSVAATGFRINPPVPFPAYAHRPQQLSEEIQEAGFARAEIVAIEGFLHLLPDLRTRMTEATSRTELLELLGQLEADPAMVAASGHILGVAAR